MKYGIAILSVIPIRKEPSHRSELASQLLFGETYEIIGQQQNWYQVKCLYDNYEGWIDQNQHHDLNVKDFAAISKGGFAVALELVSNVVSGQQSIPVVAGSSLPLFDGLNLKTGKEKFIFHGQAIPHEAKNVALLERVAMRYQQAPYLWGGRSPFGLDCSGFTQVVYKFIGIVLKRDAYQQADQGTIVNFAEEAVTGDLAFFNNGEGRIIHVGIMLKDQRIIHCSGKVRIDKIDHYGIYNNTLKKYTHQLKLIKRNF